MRGGGGRASASEEERRGAMLLVADATGGGKGGAARITGRRSGKSAATSRCVFLSVALASISGFASVGIMLSNYYYHYQPTTAEGIAEIITRRMAATTSGANFATTAAAAAPSKKEDGKTSDAGYGFPPACTDEDLATILHQLPSGQCALRHKRPWMHGGFCSFSFATRCPDPWWLQNAYKRKHYWSGNSNQQLQLEGGGDEQKQPPSSSSSASSPFTAVYVGCNKGMDAINALRMGSRNSTYDKDVWREAFFGGVEGENYTHDIAAGHCGQEYEPQFPLLPAGKNNGGGADSEAVVHCIEPLPRNSKKLSETAKELGFDSQFKVHATAISDKDGEKAYFPTATKLGDEQKGIGSCEPNEKKKGNNAADGCQEVPVKSLDSFLAEQHNSDTTSTPLPLIDLLSIDVEGYDALVLEGGMSATLPRVKYLEFEYNWKGPWSKISLSSTITKLKDAGFACYWAGSHGNLWQVTDCWHDHYDLKFWSNVACVNVRLSSARELAKGMDVMFRYTLSRGRDVRYDELETAQTDGRKKET